MVNGVRWGLLFSSRVIHRWPVLCLVLIIGLAGAQTPAQARYASIVVDAETGKVLHAANPDTPNYPASLTKMMTLYLLFEALDKGKVSLDQRFPVSRRAAAQPPTNLALTPGDSITVEQAIYALVIRSANDVAVVVAEALGDSEEQFARLMTAKARKLGMKRTVFRNASGLPDGSQQTTARELATLARALLKVFPHHYHYFAATKFTYRGRTYTTHNRLLRKYAGADGLKTGYIRASGFNVATSAVRSGRRLIGIVMGGQSPGSRDKHMANLLDQGFAEMGAGPAIASTEGAGEGESGTAAKKSTRLAAATIRPQPKPGLAGGFLFIPALKPGSEQPITVVEGSPEAGPTAVQPAQAGEVAAEASGPVAIVSSAAASEPVGDSADDMTMLVTAALETTAPAAATAVEAAAEAQPAAAAVQAALPPAPAPLGRTPGGLWAVQVGAFSRFAPANEAAEEAAKNAPALLKFAEITIEETTKDQKKLYRAQLKGLTEPVARQVCEELREKETPCMVVKPGLDVAMLLVE